MQETEWAKKIAELLEKKFPNYKIKAGKKLTYASEIVEYDEKGNVYNDQLYETDILVYEGTEESWKPRVVIETKINSASTHDAITYSQKSAAHKFVHPYLRYGIFIGNRKSLQGLLFRHGANFDFMLTWQSFAPTTNEMEALVDIIDKEIKASKVLEEMLFNSRKKDRENYFVLHKPLVMKIVDDPIK